MIRYISDDLEISSDNSDKKSFKCFSYFLINSPFPKVSINLCVADCKNVSV